MKFRPVLLGIISLILVGCGESNNNSQSTVVVNNENENNQQQTDTNIMSVNTKELAKWPSNLQKYALTYVNGNLPYYNKFNNFASQEFDGGKPVFNPSVVNTSPGVNYEEEYKKLLLDAGWKEDGSLLDEDGDTTYYFKLGKFWAQYCKYKDENKIYRFDVYCYYDYLDDSALPNSKLSLNPTLLGLTKSYTSVNSKTIGNYTISFVDMLKSNEIMQIKKETGKLIIEGPSKGISFITSRNADALFVKYGKNKNSLQYCFNNGGTFNFAEQANYIEVLTEGKAVLQLETIDVLN